MRKFKFTNNEYYHVFNRGVDKRKTFSDRKDMNRFFQSMDEFNTLDPIGSIYENSFNKEQLGGSTSKLQKDRLVEFICYCLNPNHYHFLLKQGSDKGIEKFMQRLGTGYTMYFNARNERSGVLFQGKFKAKHIIDDVYLQYFLAYIHLNPIKLIESTWKETGIKDKDQARRYLKKYQYSSFVDYCGQQRIENCIIEKNKMPSTLRMPNDFERSVEEWLQGPTL